MNFEDVVETQKGQFYFLSFSMLLHYAITGFLNPYIAIYFRQQGLPFGVIFIIFMANNAGNIAQPMWGGLSDKYDKRKIFLLIATIMWTITTLAIFISPEFWIFVIFFGLASFFGSTVQPVGRSLITLITIEKDETEYQSKFGVLMSTAFMMSSWAGGLVVAYIGFNSLFLITFMMAIISLILLTLTVKERKYSINSGSISISERGNEFNRSEISNSDNSLQNSIYFRQKILILFQNRAFIAVLICSFFGSVTFYLFFSFFSVFYVESGGEVAVLSWAFVVNFALFMSTNYLGEALTKRRRIREEETKEKGKKEFSVQLKKIFILWSIIGFSIICLLIALTPQSLLIILIVYSLPIVPFFFISMLALTAKAVRPEEKALAIGIQGVFVFVGRSLTVYIGALLLDSGGFQLTAIIDVFLLLILFVFTIITFRELNTSQFE